MWRQPLITGECPTGETFTLQPSNWNTPLYPGQNVNAPTEAFINDSAPTILDGGALQPLDSLEIGPQGELVLQGGGIPIAGSALLVEGLARGEGSLSFQSGSSGHQVNGSGRIEADDPMGNRLEVGLGGAFLDNNGILGASGSGVLAVVRDFTVDNVDGIIRALGDSEVQLGGTSALPLRIVGGQFTTSDNGVIKIPTASVAEIEGSITNLGSVEVGGELRASDSLSFTGTGAVTLTSTGTVSTIDATTTATNRAGHTINGGHGAIGGINAAIFINEGTVDADDPDRRLQMTGAVTNNNVLEASDEGNLTLFTGVFVNQGIIRALADSRVDLLTGSRVIGGTLSTTGTGRIVVPSTSTGAIIEGVVENLGVVEVDGGLDISTNLTLTGVGRLRVSGRIDGSATLTNTATHTIHGDGRVFDVLLINKGSVSGDGFTASEWLELRNGRVEGSGALDNAFCLNCTIAPGDGIGTVSFGSVDYNGVLEIEIGGLTPGVGHDRVNHVLGQGIANLGGTLSIDLADDYSPDFSDSFTILTATTLSGVFLGGGRLMTAGGEGSFAIEYDATNGEVVLSAFQTDLAGDYNNDGVVDAVDFTVWRESEGAPAGTLPNDPDGGVIGTAQYMTWRDNYGASLAASPASSNTVPEPAGCALGLLGWWFLAARRRPSPSR